MQGRGDRLEIAGTATLSDRAHLARNMTQERSDDLRDHLSAEFLLEIPEDSEIIMPGVCHTEAALRFGANRMIKVTSFPRSL
jgi:hypothetical protein